MARWLVVSDNHGDREILVSLRQALKPDAVFHCGDSEMEAADPWFKGHMWFKVTWTSIVNYR